MEVWNTFQRQVVMLWRQWSMQQRVGISAAAVACLAAVIGTLIWATQPEYVVLASASSIHEADSITEKLEAEQIDYNLSPSGTVVFVSRGDRAKARMAVKDVVDPMGVEEAGSSGMFSGTPDEEADRRQHVLEKRLAQTIQTIKGIRTATVHITPADYSPFVSEQTPTKASIMVTPASRGSLNNRVAQSVILLVARAVKGLTPENIHLTDPNGSRYSMSDGIGGDMTGRFEYQQRLELSLAQNAESMLNSVLGDGRSQVRVAADIDFREVSREETTFDPDIKVKRTENVESVTSEGGAGGAAGLGPNQNADVPATAKSGKFKSETSTTDYDTASTRETTLVSPGTIKRLTVAVVADLTSETVEGDEPDAAVTSPSITKEDVEDIVKNAVGFDDVGRDDTIQVVVAPLSVPEIATEDPGFMPLYEQYQPLIEAVLVGLGATLAFFIAVLALRKLKPVIEQEDAVPGFNREDYERMAELSQKAKANPEVAARILATWLGQELPNETPETEAPRRSRAA